MDVQIFLKGFTQMFLGTRSNFFFKSVQNLSMDIQMFFKGYTQMFLGT